MVFIFWNIAYHTKSFTLKFHMFPTWFKCWVLPTRVAHSLQVFNGFFDSRIDLGRFSIFRPLWEYHASQPLFTCSTLSQEKYKSLNPKRKIPGEYRADKSKLVEKIP